MPFTGQGTGIENANDVFFAGLTSNNVIRYNGSTFKWNNVDLVVSTADLANDTVTEPKLAISNTATTGQVLSWNGTALTWVAQSVTPADATTTTKGIVQLAGDLGGTASVPTVPGLAGKANTVHSHAQSDVTGLTAALAAKEASITAGTIAQYYRGDKTWQPLDKTAVGLANVDNTSDANKPVSSATVTALAGKEATITAGTTAQYYRGDKTWQALNKTAAGLANVDNTSDAAKPVSTAAQTALNAKADNTITITGATSLTGGGNLTINRTISLVGDSAAPGNTMYYGTNGTGVKGFYTVPGGDPTMGGDLTGPASNAQIAASAVGTNELAPTAVTAAKLATDSVTEPKLALANAPATGQVLSWNGTAMAWAGALAFAFTRVNVSANYTAGSFEYVFVDATTTGVTVTLPSPQLNWYLRVKRMSAGANGVQVVAPAGAYIDAVGVGSDVLNTQYDSSEYWSDGVNWFR